MPPETSAEAQLRRRLRDLFAEELHDGLQLLTGGLLSLEAGVDAAAQAELVRELFRAAHSLKGAAHAAGFPEAVVVCDRLETALAAVRDGEVAADAGLVTQLLGASTCSQVWRPSCAAPPRWCPGRRCRSRRVRWRRRRPSRRTRPPVACGSPSRRSMPCPSRPARTWPRRGG